MPAAAGLGSSKRFSNSLVRIGIDSAARGNRERRRRARESQQIAINRRV
jgi:hypothetical protein